jgi:hypothetical protein
MAISVFLEVTPCNLVVNSYQTTKCNIPEGRYIIAVYSVRRNNLYKRHELRDLIIIIMLYSLLLGLGCFSVF